MKKFVLLSMMIFVCRGLVLAETASPPWQNRQTDDLNYLIYIPKNISAEEAPSLMISLHGCAQHAEDLASLANWESAAELNHAIVVLPNVPNGGVVFGCWDYYGRDHTEKNRHNRSLILLTESLMADKKLNINKEKIFISGLSSGAGQAAVLGCMRPDLFSGVGLNSGPAVGTERNEVYDPQVFSDQIADFCTKLAGARATHFSRQIFSVMVGDKDFVVNPKHSELAIQAMKKIYQTKSEKDLDLSTLKGVSHQGRGFIFGDEKEKPRISYIINNGLGHAWASGKGPGRVEHYVNPNSINYPQYLMDLLINR